MANANSTSKKGITRNFSFVEKQQTSVSGRDVSVQFSAVYPSTIQITGHVTIHTDIPSQYKQFKTVSSQNFL